MSRANASNILERIIFNQVISSVSDGDEWSKQDPAISAEQSAPQKEQDSTAEQIVVKEDNDSIAEQPVVQDLDPITEQTVVEDHHLPVEVPVEQNISAENLGVLLEKIRRERIENIRKLALGERQLNFLKRKIDVMKFVETDFSNYLLVWCPMKKIPHEYIISALAKIERSVEIREHFGQSSDFFQKVFLAIFEKDELGDSRAAAAAKEISFTSRFITTIGLDVFLDFILEAELRHPMVGIGGTRVIVSSKKAYHFENVKAYNDFVASLRIFGKLNSVIFLPMFPLDRTIIELTYAYAAHAYSAMFYFNGLELKNPKRRHTAHIVETSYEKEIFKAVKSRMVDFMDESKYVPLCIT